MPKWSDPEPIDQQLVTALGYSLRVKILQILNEREASPKELAAILKEPIGSISYHVRVLKECEVVKLVRTDPQRGAYEHFYRAEPRSFIGHQDWRKVPRSLRGSVTASSLKTFMAKVIVALKAGTIDGRDDTPFSWFGISVDKVGWKQVVEIMKATTAQLKAVHEQSQQRARMSGERLMPLVIGLAAFEAARSKGK